MWLPFESPKGHTTCRRPPGSWVMSLAPPLRSCAGPGNSIGGWKPAPLKCCTTLLPTAFADIRNVPAGPVARRMYAAWAEKSCAGVQVAISLGSPPDCCCRNCAAPELLAKTARMLLPVIATDGLYG